MPEEGEEAGDSPGAERATGLSRAVSAIGAVAPGLDGTALAEALWLASRMAAGSASPTPGEPAPAPAQAPGRTGPSVQPLRRVGDFVRQSPPTAPENPSARPLHERLPGSTNHVPGDAVAVPRATALPSALEMTRALRPWKRPWRTGRRQALDLDATVAGYARSGELIPVFAPAPERWFDLVLVVDRSPSMQVWRETVGAFAGLLDRLGAFRTLQVRDLTVDPDDGVGLTDRQGLPTSTGQLGSPDGRRLILVVSDCAAPAWRASEIWQQLRAWASHEPVALLNPLPPKLWRRTGLDLPAVRVSPDAPGTGNTGLRFRLPPLLAAGEADPDGWLALPVLSLSPHALGRWSRTVMLAAPEGCSAALIPPAGRPTALGTGRPPARRSAEARADGFLRTASPSAARLALLTSVFDRLSLDLLHVLRQELVPEATTEDLAELLGSGLYALDTDTGGPVTLTPAPEVRARLEEALTEHDTLRLNRVLDRHISSGQGGGGRLSAVAGRSDGDKEITAEATAAGVAWGRTLELLGLPLPTGGTEPAESVGAATELTDTADLALRVALAMLPQDRQAEAGELHETVHSVVTLLAARGLAVDSTALLRQLEASVVQFVTRPAVLEDDRDHEPWSADGDGTRAREFWERYLRFLEYERILPPAQVRQLDDVTSGLLSHLEDPRRPGGWRRTGLVMAPVGSGKSTSVVALAAKAVDAGYGTVVIMAGTTNAARDQMQQRVDEGLLGFDSQYAGSSEVGGRIGAGAMPHARVLPIVSVTARGEQGDFGGHRAMVVGAFPSACPQVFVIKKHRRIVDSVRHWLAHTSQPEDPPMLVIDTTGDARGTLSTPSKVDESVERLLSSCPRVGYVGYTYAPFLTTSQVLPDFIFHVPKPPGHFGPEELFTDTEQPLPVVRTVFDQDRWLPPGHRADRVPGRELPDSLFTALQSFVLACAARRVRDRKRTSNSMLVSVSRFVAVQTRVCDQLAERVDFIAEDLRDRRGPRGQRLMADFEKLWRQDFVPTSEAIADAAVPAVSWKQVADQLPIVAQQLVVVTANSASDMMPHLDESEYGGLNIVAVGDAKPAQGLPLEGLTTSYCLRAPANYETLRLLTTPFGPHTGYQDLCRLYATLEVLDTQHRLTARINGQRKELQELASLDITPAQAVLHVRATHSPGRSWETLDFTLALERVRQNFRTLEAFIRGLGRTGTPDPRTDRNLLWRGVTPAKVTEFLDAYLPGSEPSWNRLVEICGYVRRGAGLGELGEWTVQLVSPPKSPVLVEVAGHPVGVVRRAPLPRGNEDGFRIRRLSAVGNEYADLDPVQYLRAIDATRSAVAVDPARSARGHEPTRPSRAAVEAVRRPDQALLSIYLVRGEETVDYEVTAPLVGLAVSLPRSAALSEPSSPLS
ncbi:Z1 domain-containing protein [Streptomyces mirabilis]|uniref:Z1 domain-containing protein n=1 Tax=Streptomyces mirabilis TaxID=68239 RepID=A0A1I2KHR9_9ACTN|nr:Z1 domain-containing protein [Streptomyces mirabilis]SFF65888.1 Z1 domain-containing protein [Streptomyces mirabilis]